MTGIHLMALYKCIQYLLVVPTTEINIGKSQLNVYKMLLLLFITINVVLMEEQYYGLV